jgi:hypothetical protein
LRRKSSTETKRHGEERGLITSDSATIIAKTLNHRYIIEDAIRMAFYPIAPSQ